MAPIEATTHLSSPVVSQNPEAVSPEHAIPDMLPGCWWVAHTKPRNEKALAADLTRLGIFHYLPLRKRESRSRKTRRISRSLLPVFPGYLFFNGREDQRHRALATHRIANVLAVMAQDRLIMELRQVHKALLAGVDVRWHREIRVGQAARVVEGPLIGVEGVISKRLSKLRLILNVEMLGQSISVDVSAHQLEPI
jgi:transcription antitermination factor NusG